MSLPFMQFYPGDYLEDTRHLTTEQHGAYLLVLMTMWNAGGRLPNDEIKLARIAGLSPARWRKINPEVMAFMTVEGGEITQKRLAKERKKTVEKSQKRSEAGKLGNEAKSLKRKEPTIANAYANANAMRTHLSEPEVEVRSIPSSREDGRLGAVLPFMKPEPPNPEADYFRRGREVLGAKAGAVLAKLLKSQGNSVALARAMIEQASTKHRPLEWTMRVINGRKAEEDEIWCRESL